ncbi:hypothetical protein BBO01nite_05380 [Brevibacillus borstelensis]|nr:hypothetical protein BBO01nite_05380 [Brevibacillus borstelensis]
MLMNDTVADDTLREFCYTDKRGFIDEGGVLDGSERNAGSMR